MNLMNLPEQFTVTILQEDLDNSKKRLASAYANICRDCIMGMALKRLFPNFFSSCGANKAYFRKESDVATYQCEKLDKKSFTMSGDKEILEGKFDHVVGTSYTFTK